MSPGESTLSVIRSVKNDARRLKRTILSVAEQDYGDLEYIVVDGGSTDGTAGIADRHKATVSRFVSREDEGVYHGMMHGAGLAAGEWITFLNAGDTYCGKDVLSRIMKETSPEVDVVYGDHYYGDETEPRRSLPFETLVERLQTGDLDESWIIGFPCHQAVFVRTALMREMTYDTRYRHAAEQEFLFSAFAAGRRFHRCDVAVCRYEAGGMSHNRQVDMLLEKRAILKKHGGGFAVDAFFTKRILGVLKRRLKESLVPR